jgi:DNA-binding NarL/FixJ family response regulator
MGGAALPNPPGGRGGFAERAVDWALNADAGSTLGGAKSSGPLTAREREVARLLAQDYTNRQIAEALVIAERTAETHVTNILTKLNLASRVQVGPWALAHGLAPPDSK